MTELEKAKLIAASVVPTLHAEFSCMLVASAIAGMRGLTMRHIRVGALFWPAKFAGDPALSMRGGWGCEGYSASDKRLFLADEDVDDDGGFSGHTWIEPEAETVVDLMHDVDDGMREVLAEDFNIVGRYIVRPKLERAVKAYWRKQMLAAIKEGTKA